MTVAATLARIDPPLMDPPVGYDGLAVFQGQVAGDVSGGAIQLNCDLVDSKARHVVCLWIEASANGVAGGWRAARNVNSGHIPDITTSSVFPWSGDSITLSAHETVANQDRFQPFYVGHYDGSISSILQITAETNTDTKLYGAIVVLIWKYGRMQWPYPVLRGIQ